MFSREDARVHHMTSDIQPPLYPRKTGLDWSFTCRFDVVACRVAADVERAATVRPR